MKLSFESLTKLFFYPAFSFFNLIVVMVGIMFYPYVVNWSPIYGPAILAVIMVFGLFIDGIVILMIERSKVEKLQKEIEKLSTHA